MSTISLSLPTKQKQQLDQMVEEYGFANRSELIRSLMRFVRSQPNLLKEAASYPFVSPTEKSAKKIVKGFEKKGYTAEFLKDLEEGLADSDYFAK